MKYRQEERQFNPDEMKAVSGLLQVAERRTIIQDNWYQRQGLRFSQSLQMKKQRNKEDKGKMQPLQSKSIQKKHEKDRLKQLIRQPARNEQFCLFQKELPVISQRNEHAAKVDRYSKLFNTNMTFYGRQRNSNKEFVRSSMTFYQKAERKVPSEYSPLPSHYANINPNSSIVYFKPNKSETVRELLNQMRKSQDKSNKIVLNSKNHLEQDQSQDIEELGEVIRYKKSECLQGEQSLLRSGENIWKRKFKESWIRKKYDLQERRSHLKKLIVND